MSIAQRLQDKGERIGWEGHQKGIEQERLRAYQCQLEMARHLLKNGINIELVIESTGLSREELTEIS
ncbi:transposase [Proteus myxofaciens ATCC 19692]|uniref:Transposase n=1 Tax=Proteus myxofaciens ATCC 19692 TaxID=1354337 RepID=A0A198GNJ2_9GAMM|nr:transposase [Proteus myxofaciens ATCC 19692]